MFVMIVCKAAAETKCLQFLSTTEREKKKKQGHDIQQGDYQSSRKGSASPQSTPTQETDHHVAEQDAKNE